MFVFTMTQTGYKRIKNDVEKKVLIPSLQNINIYLYKSIRSVYIYLYCVVNYFIQSIPYYIYEICKIYIKKLDLYRYKVNQLLIIKR